MSEIAILSPYRKDVHLELRSVYGLAGLEELASRVEYAARSVWGLPARVDQIHVSFGLAIRFWSGRSLYYLKLASTRKMSGRQDTQRAAFERPSGERRPARNGGDG